MTESILTNPTEVATLYNLMFSPPGANGLNSEIKVKKNKKKRNKV